MKFDKLIQKIKFDKASLKKHIKVIVPVLTAVFVIATFSFSSMGKSESTKGKS